MQTNFQDRYNWMEEMIYCVHSLMQCNISSAQELPAHHTHIFPGTNEIVLLSNLTFV